MVLLREHSRLRYDMNVRTPSLKLSLEIDIDSTIYSRHYESMSYANCCRVNTNVTRHKLSINCSSGNITSNKDPVSFFVIIQCHNVHAG